MIHRHYVQCPGCEQPFTLRLGISNWPDMRFYVSCPHCTIPIRGTQKGNTPEDYLVSFEAKTLTEIPDPEPEPIVTVHPELPSRTDADPMRNFVVGAMPTHTLVSLVGFENIKTIMGTMWTAEEVRSNGWTLVSRLFDYYMLNDAENMKRTLQKIDPALADLPVAKHHERTSTAHNVLLLTTTSVIGPLSESMKFYHRYTRKHMAALESNRDYVHMAQGLEDNGTLASMQRSIMSQLGSFISSANTWHLGMLTRYLTPEGKQHMEELRMFRDEFDTLQNLYVQGFELICKTLRFPVAAQNAVKRGDPNDFGTAAPHDVTDVRRNPPSSISKYIKLSNADQICYVRAIPGMEGWTDYLDNKMRNAIGHATAQHDLAKGVIISDKHPNGVPYIDLMSSVFDLFDALAMAAQVVRTQRVMASPDFGVPRS